MRKTRCFRSLLLSGPTESSTRSLFVCISSDGLGCPSSCLKLSQCDICRLGSPAQASMRRQLIFVTPGIAHIEYHTIGSRVNWCVNDLWKHSHHGSTWSAQAAGTAKPSFAVDLLTDPELKYEDDQICIVLGDLYSAGSDTVRKCRSVTLIDSNVDPAVAHRILSVGPRRSHTVSTR